MVWQISQNLSKGFKVINNFRENNINIVSYFIAEDGYSYGKDEFKRMADVYFSNKDDAEFCLKYLHLRFVENKQIFASFANNAASPVFGFSSMVE
jgi:hypothetical protein